MATTEKAFSIKPVVTDEIYELFKTLPAGEQKSVLNSLKEDELLNIYLRQKNQFNLPDEEFVKAYSQARIDYGAGGAFPTDPTGMPIYGSPIEGSQAQDFAKELFSGLREASFDYSGIDNNKLRAGLSFMDTGEEKENYLTQNIGPKGTAWTMDKYGRYAVMPEFLQTIGAPPSDKPVTIDNPGVFERGDVSDLVGSSPELIGTILASIASRNYGLIPAFLSSAGGAAVGKTIEEGTETLAGLQKQGLGEVVGDIGDEALLGGIAEIGGRALVGAGKKIFSPAEVRIPTGEKGVFNLNTYQYAPRVDAASGPGVTQTQTMVRELLDDGAIPDVKKATDRNMLGFFAGLGERIIGYNQQKNVTNVKYMQDKINGFLTDVGADPFDPFMGKVFPKLGEEELGALIQMQINNSKSALEVAAENSLKVLKETIKAESDSLSGRVGTGESVTGKQLADNVAEANANFQVAMSKLYNEADQLLGNKAFIPTDGLKRQAQSILDDLPRDADGIVIGGADEGVSLLQQLVNLPAHVNTTHMSALRTRFGNAAFNDDMLKTVGNRQYSLLKGATNDAFDEAVNSGTKMFNYIDSAGNRVLAKRAMTPKEIERNRLGLEKLKEASKKYGEGISVFDNRLIRGLTKQDGVDADLIISRAVSRNQPGKIKQFINASDDPEATRKMLQSGHFDSMVTNATDIDGNFSAGRMLAEIKKLGTSYPALYRDSARVITNSLTQLRNAQQFIPKDDIVRIKRSLMDSLESGNFGEFKNVVKNYTKSVNDNYALLESNFAKQLGTMSPEEVIPYLTNKAKSNDISAFINYYSKESPEIVTEFRRKYMVNLLDNVFDSTNANPVGIVLNGENLLKAIQKEGGAARLRATFGGETAQALEKFAEKAAFLTTKGEGFAGGLVAMGIALNPLQNLGRLLKINLVTDMLSKPGTLRYLTTIIENPNARSAGYAAGQIAADLIAQISTEDSTVDPEQIEKMKLELQNSLLDLKIDITQKEEEQDD